MCFDDPLKRAVKSFGINQSFLVELGIFFLAKAMVTNQCARRGRSLELPIMTNSYLMKLGLAARLHNFERPERLVTNLGL